MNNKLMELLTMLQGQTTNVGKKIGSGIENLGTKLSGTMSPENWDIGFNNIAQGSGAGEYANKAQVYDDFANLNMFNKEGASTVLPELNKVDDLMAMLGKKAQSAGKYIQGNPLQALGGVALGGLNVAGLADKQDILSQLLAAAGGAGLGYAKGGVPGAVMGGLGGGAAGDMLPKLVRMLQGQ